MSEDSRPREVGTIGHEYDYSTFNWKIPNASSIPQEVDYAVQSPSFTFAKASFILKMYPHGQTKYETEGYMDLVFERVHPQTGENRVLYTVFYKNVVTGDYAIKAGNFLFEPEWKQAKVMRFMPSRKRCLEKWNFPNDIFTLTIVFGNRFTAISEVSLEIDSLGTAVGEKCTASEYVECQEIGKLFSDNFVSKTFIWLQKRPNNLKLSFPLPPDYYVQSPEFVFGGATWILKMHFLKKDSKQVNINMILKRLRSGTHPQHNIMLKIKTCGKSFDALFCFDALRGVENGMDIPIEEELKNNVLELQDFSFDVDIRMKKNTVNELRSSMKLESPKKMYRGEPKSSTSSAKESPEKMLRRVPKSSISSAKESPEKMPRRVPKSSTSSAKESPEKMPRGEPKSSTSSDKESPEKMPRGEPKSSTSSAKESSEQILRQKPKSSTSTTKESPEKISREKSKSPTFINEESSEETDNENPESPTSATKESAEETYRENSETPASNSKGDERTWRSSTALRMNEVIFYVVLGFLCGFFFTLYNGFNKK